MPLEPSPGGLRMRSLNVVGLILWANQIEDASQITGGPDWIHTKDFDITAKTSGPTSTDEVRLMLQALLAERFRLAAHREQRVVPSYSLVVDKGGPKLREVQQEPRRGGMLGWSDGKVTYKMVNHMSQLVSTLSSFLDDRPVTDKTGLTGVYEITLTADMDADQMKRMPQVGMAFTGFGYTSGVFDALKTLGLKLEAGRGTVDFLVIDHVEQPSGN